jgi:putative ABC transport system permease protein
VRRAAAEAAPGRPLANIQSLNRYGAAVRDRGYSALVLAIFAMVATLLAATGVYGVMAYSVAQRRMEIGIRMTLGASGRQIVKLIGGQALLLIVSGLALGLAGSVLLTRLISSQLWGVAPTDPLTFAGVTALLALVALTACLVPIRRAIRVNPMRVLGQQ